MVDSLAVRLGGVPAGTLTRLPGGRLRFDYDDAYRAGEASTPLSVAMPLPIRSHADRVVAPWLWGLLPDNEAVLSRWARELHVSAASPFSLLASPIGQDCPGAVTFDASDALEEDSGDGVTWLSDEAVGVRLRELREDSTAWLGRDFAGRFSLAGAQAKTALLHEAGRWGLPTGALATSHILKPAVAGLDHHDLNEHLCLDAARRAGLLVARTRVARFGEETAIVVERYDRRLRGEALTRIHQEDLCQALGVAPSHKYQSDGGPGPREVAGLLRDTMPRSVAEGAIARFLDALAFNWLIAGTDAHAKNYSLLLAGGQVRLAPLYDIASALPYGLHEKKLRLAMKLADYRVALERDPWPRVAEQLGLDAERVRDRVRELLALAPDAFADAGAAPGVVELDRPLPVRLVDLIADRVGRCGALLDRAPAGEG